MVQNFKTAFDARTSTDLGSYSNTQYILFLLGVFIVSAALIFFAFHKKKNGWEKFIAIPIVISGFSVFLMLDYADRHYSIEELSAGKLMAVQGCVSDFYTNPGEPHSSRSSFPDETWSVGGKRFGYKDASDFPGYLRMESRGGVVHKGQYLRVGFLVSPVFRRREIMKIEVGTKLCG